MDHILLHCKVTTGLWLDIFKWFSISWVMPRSVNESARRMGLGTSRLDVDHLEIEI